MILTDKTVSLILWQTLTIFLFIFALFGVVIALLLIFKPHLMARINPLSNKWISTRHLSLFLDQGFCIEQWFYRHHTSFGLFIMLGASYMLVYFGLLFDRSAALIRLGSVAHRLPMQVAIDSLVLIALTCGVVSLLVGLFLWQRPSMLRGVEEGTNRWISTRKATKFLEIPRDDIERLVEEHAPRIGWLLLLGALFLIFLLSRLVV